jgi:hypothetical protein
MVDCDLERLTRSNQEAGEFEGCEKFEKDCKEQKA